MASPLQRAFANQKNQVANNGNYSAIAPVTQSKHADLLLKEFESDCLALKAITQISEKVAYKRDVLLPKYSSFLQDWYQGKSNHLVIPKLILWLFDVDLVGQFFAYCCKAIELGLPSPIKRDWATLCVESIAEWSLKQGEQGNSAEPYLSQVVEKLNTGEWRIFEKVACKAYKNAGLNLLRNDAGKVNAAHIGDIAALQEAQVLLTKANKLYDKCGVGDLINNRIPSRIRKLRKFAEQK